MCSFWHHRWASPPRRALDRSVYQPTQWTVANVGHLSIIHLGGHAHLWCQKLHKLHIFKTACNDWSHTYLVVKYVPFNDRWIPMKAAGRSPFACVSCVCVCVFVVRAPCQEGTVSLWSTWAWWSSTWLEERTGASTRARVSERPTTSWRSRTKWEGKQRAVKNAVKNAVKMIRWGWT